MMKIDNNHSVRQPAPQPDSNGANYQYLVAMVMGNLLATNDAIWKSGQKEREQLLLKDLYLKSLSNYDDLDGMIQMLQNAMADMKDNPEMLNWLKSELSNVQGYRDTQDRASYDHYEQKVEDGGTKHTRTIFGPWGEHWTKTWYTTDRCRAEANGYRQKYQAAEKVGAHAFAGICNGEEGKTSQEVQANFATLSRYFDQENQVASIISSLYGQDND